MITDILSADFSLKNNSFPKNIYAIRIKDEKGNLYDIVIQHNGYCPDIQTERDHSRFNDYLSNLEYSTVTEFFKSIKKSKPKVYSTQLEVVTDQTGKLFHLSRVNNNI